MTPTQLEDLLEHLVELLVELLILVKVIRQPEPPPGDDLPETNETPGPG